MSQNSGSPIGDAMTCSAHTSFLGTSSQLKGAQVTNVDLLFSVHPTVANQMATEFLGILYIDNPPVSPSCSDAELVTIACSNTRALSSSRRSSKQREPFKSIGPIIGCVFTDKTIILCAISCQLPVDSESKRYHALLHPAENRTAVLLIYPELSDMDIERISSTRNENNTVSPFSVPGSTSSQSPSAHMLPLSRENSPSEFSSALRVSPGLRQQPLASRGQQMAIHRFAVGNPLQVSGINLLSDRHGVKKRNSSTPVGEGAPALISAGSGRSRQIRRIGSLNSLLKNKPTSNVSNSNAEYGKYSSAFEATSAAGGGIRPHSEPTVPIATLTPEESEAFRRQGSNLSANTGSTVMYTPPESEQDMFSRLEQRQGTSPTVRYNLSVSRPHSANCLFSPATPISKDTDVAVNTPIQVDNGSVLFYSPESFTHDYVVEDGDGSRSILAELADCNQPASKAGASRSSSGAASTGKKKETIKITQNQSLFSMIMEEANDKIAPLSPTPRRDLTDNIVEMMDKNLASELPQVKMDIVNESVSRLLVDEPVDQKPDEWTEVEPTPQMKRAEWLRDRMATSKLWGNVKRSKNLKASLLSTTEECILTRITYPLSAARKLCQAVEKAYNTKMRKAGDDEGLRISYSSLLVDCFGLFEHLSQSLVTPRQDTEVIGGLEDREIAALYMLNLFFIFESVKNCRMKMKSDKHAGIVRKDYNYVFRKGKGYLFNVVDELGILFKSRESKTFYADCEIEWLLSTGGEALLTALCNKLALLESLDEPINFIQLLCDSLREIYPKAVPDLTSALKDYDDVASIQDTRSSEKGELTESSRRSSDPAPGIPPMIKESADKTVIPFSLGKKPGAAPLMRRSYSTGNITDRESISMGVFSMDGELSSKAFRDCISTENSAELESESAFSRPKEFFPVSSTGKKAVNSLLGTPRSTGINGNRTGVENRLRRTVSASKSSSFTTRTSHSTTSSNSSSAGSNGQLVGKEKVSSRPPVPVKKNISSTSRRTRGVASTTGTVDTNEQKNDNGKRSRPRSNVVESTPISKLRR